MRFSKRGTTLIEVMIALVVFSFSIGLTSGFVREGIEYPYIAGGVSDWLNFIEDLSALIQTLPADSDLDKIEVNKAPFNSIAKPSNLKSWAIHTKTSNIESTFVFRIEMVSKQNRYFEWFLFKKMDEH